MASRSRAILNNLNDRAKEVGIFDQTLTLDDLEAVRAFYDFTCLKCGTKPAISIDHVIPLSLGGTNTRDNLQNLCQKCNKQKRDGGIDYRQGKVVPPDYLSPEQQARKDKYDAIVKEKVAERVAQYEEYRRGLPYERYIRGESHFVDMILDRLAESPTDEQTKKATHNHIVRTFRWLQKQSERPAISSELRNKVHSLTNGFCFWCGSELDSSWHCDHFIPFSKGGKTDVSNLVPACRSCNLRKHDKLPNDAAVSKFNRMLSDLHNVSQATGELQENG